jgi:hypothetical protein
MIENDHIRKTLDHYRRLREKRIEEVQPILDEIRGYELIIQKLASDAKEPANIEPFSLGTSAMPENPAPANTLTPKPAAKATIKPDEFFQMSQSDAARAYLRMVGRAISMDELVSALQAGGAKVGGADPKRTLYVSLKANPKKEFVWPGKDHIGLAEFYLSRK